MLREVPIEGTTQVVLCSRMKASLAWSSKEPLNRGASRKKSSEDGGDLAPHNYSFGDLKRAIVGII